MTLSKTAVSEDFIPMSYLVKRSQAGYVATALSGWFGEILGVNLWGVWKADAWRKDNMQFYLWDKDSPDLRITFGPISWDPINSQWTYGKTVILKEALQEISGSAILLKNQGSEDPLEFSRDAEVALEQSRSTSTDKEISVDIGVKTTASIGGDAVGAKLEQEVSASLGIKTDVATAEEESKGTTTTLHIAEDVSPGKDTLVTINAPTVSSQTPFTMSSAWMPKWIEFEANPSQVRNGPNGGAGQLGWPDIGNTDCYTDGACENHKFRLDWDDFLSLIGGYNTNYPHFSSKNGAVARPRVEDPSRRWVSMKGTQHRTYQDAATYTLTDVTGQDLDAVSEKHGIDNSNIITRGT